MVQPRYSNTDYHGSILVEIRREIGDILGEIRNIFINDNIFIFKLKHSSVLSIVKFLLIQDLVSIDVLKQEIFTLKVLKQLV